LLMSRNDGKRLRNNTAAEAMAAIASP